MHGAVKAAEELQRAYQDVAVGELPLPVIVCGDDIKACGYQPFEGLTTRR